MSTNLVDLRPEDAIVLCKSWTGYARVHLRRRLARVTESPDPTRINDPRLCWVSYVNPLP